MGKSDKKKRKSKKPKKKQHTKPPTLADTWDRFLLYQLSVQDPVAPTLDLMRDTFRKHRDRRAKILREDFCGTALMSIEWLRGGGSRRAIGIDIDRETLRWSEDHLVSQLSAKERARLQLVEGDVRDDPPAAADIACAYNFSYMIFDTRDTLRAYFAHVRDTIADDGLLFLDAFGGGEAMSQLEETTDHALDADDIDSELLKSLLGDRTAEFGYVWDQQRFNPVDHDMRCAIHFTFADGSAHRDAFSYHWRLWTIPELRELLAEAGFARTEVYWETTDEDGDFDGYAQTETIEDDPCWIAFLCALK